MSLVCIVSHESIDGLCSITTDTSLGWGKKWLDVGDLDLIFKVTLAIWNENFDRKKTNLWPAGGATGDIL